MAVINSIRCKVIINGNVLTFTNERSVSIDLTQARKPGAMSDLEAGLLDTLTEGLPVNVTDTADLTPASMRVLLALSKRFEPAPVQPVRAGNAPATTQARTAGKVVSGHTDRTTFSSRSGGEADYAEARVDQLRRVATDVQTASYTLVIYDIKDHQETVCPNPSWRITMRDEPANDEAIGERWTFPGMWRMGFRMNLSCWAVDSRLLPGGEDENPALARLFTHWDRHGVDFHCFRFHEEDMGKIRELAQKRLDDELRSLHTSLIERINRADAALAEAQAGMEARAVLGEEVTLTEQERAESRRDNAVRAMLRDASEKFAACLECAERFDMSMEDNDLFAAYREAIAAHRIAFNARMVREGRSVRLHVEAAS
jgi:hypothetical protein